MLVTIVIFFCEAFKKGLLADFQRKPKNSEFPWMLTPMCHIGKKTSLYCGRQPDLLVAKLWPDRKTKSSPVIVPFLLEPHGTMTVIPGEMANDDGFGSIFSPRMPVVGMITSSDWARPHSKCVRECPW